MNLAPITLFVYNRPKHALKVLEALSANDLAEASELFIFADGPKEKASHQELRMIEETRQVIRRKKWCGKVTIRESDVNKGLSRSITESVSEIVNSFGCVIVLEDDIVTSPCFLTYMNKALKHYEDQVKVMSISGYFYPVRHKLPDYFFLCFDSSWGWGTWKRAWAKYNPDTDVLLEEITRRHEGRNCFNFDGAFDFYQMLKSQQAGTIDSWSIRWYASILLENGLTLYPAKSFVKNIGHDGSGRHSPNSTIYDTAVEKQFHAPCFPKNIQEDSNARTYLAAYFTQVNKISMISRIKAKLSQLIGR